MTQPTAGRSRRTVLRDLGRTSVGLLVVGAGLAGCDTGGDPVVQSSASSGGQAASEDTAGAAGPAPAIIEIDFVAAYVVARGGQATLIDTGVAGSEDAIEGVLTDLGLGWGDLSDVIVTHSHGDHAGSLMAVSEAAADAAIWAGAADLGSMSSAREITAVGDGDQVFGMDIVETPGHTPGHISVLDGGILFTGDALVGSSGAVAGPPERFTSDMPAAIESIAKLGGMDVSSINVFHGWPVEGTAADLAELAGSLA